MNICLMCLWILSCSTTLSEMMYHSLLQFWTRSANNRSTSHFLQNPARTNTCNCTSKQQHTFFFIKMFPAILQYAIFKLFHSIITSLIPGLPTHLYRRYKVSDTWLSHRHMMHTTNYNGHIFIETLPGFGVTFYWHVVTSTMLGNHCVICRSCNSTKDVWINQWMLSLRF